MFKIGDFSKLTKLTVRTLHHYEKMELLTPDKIDVFTNYRYYSAKQLETVNAIRNLQEIGLPLKSIKIIINSNDVNILDSYYQLQTVAIESELKELQKKKTLIEAYTKKRKEGFNMTKYKVELKEVNERKVMSLRSVIPTFNDEGALWSDLYNESLRQQVTLTTPPEGLTFYHDKEYKESDVDVEVQSNIVGEYEDTDKVKYITAPGFTMASVTFNGSYDQMPEVNQALAAWIEANNYKITGPMVNISHVSPAQDPNPDNWVTESGIIITI